MGKLSVNVLAVSSCCYDSQFKILFYKSFMFLNNKEIELLVIVASRFISISTERTDPSYVKSLIFINLH